MTTSAAHRRTSLSAILLGTLLLLLLGAFPPQPTPQPVQRVLPNDQFQPR